MVVRKSQRRQWGVAWGTVQRGNGLAGGKEMVPQLSLGSGWVDSL